MKRASLAQEVKKGNVAFPTSQKNPDSISNMEKGMTTLVLKCHSLLLTIRAVDVISSTYLLDPFREEKDTTRFHGLSLAWKEMSYLGVSLDVAYERHHTFLPSCVGRVSANFKISKGTTFAARARAAELNSARAAAAAKDAITSGEGMLDSIMSQS